MGLYVHDPLFWLCNLIEHMQNHGADLFDIYGPGDLTDVLINFATNLDPNGVTVINWPEYTSTSPVQLALNDGDVAQTITSDNYRVDGMRTLIEASLTYPH